MKVDLRSSVKGRLRYLPLLLIFCWCQGALTSISAVTPSEGLAASSAPSSSQEAPTNAASSATPASGAPAAGMVRQLTFEPGLPVTGDELKVVIPGSEQTPVRTQIFYTWKINGRVVQESWENALEAAFKRGDIIEVEAASREAVSAGSPPRTHSVIVGNAPPKLRLSEQSMDGTGIYRARLEASDPENDPIAFSLKSGPPGMTVDPKTGAVLWSAEAGRDATFAVSVAARDTVGGETVLAYQVKAQWQTKDGVENHASSKASAQ